MTPAEFVRDLLSGDHLEEAERAAAELGCDAPIVMIPDAGCHVALARLVGWVTYLPACIDALRDLTVLGGPNDPTEPGADQPWRSLVFKLLSHDLVSAERAARLWYRALRDASLQADPPLVHGAMAAYLMGIIEAHLENDHWAELGIVIGAEAAAEDGDATSVFLAACRFVRTGLR